MTTGSGLFRGAGSGAGTARVAYFALSLLASLACLLTLSQAAPAALNDVPDPTDGTDGTVRAIVRVGDTIYLGGTFEQFGDVRRFNIAAIDANTGRLKESWNPRINCCVKTLAASEDGQTIYAGGNFTSVGDSTHNNIAAIDAATGQVSDTWSPDVGPAGTSAVNSIAVQDDRVYFGGSFATVDGEARSNLAMVSGPDAALSSTWRPSARGTVNKLVAAGSRFYVGGSFRSVGGERRRNLTSLSASTGRATGWRPNPARPIWDLAVSGGRVYTAEGGGRGGAASSYKVASGRRAWALHTGGDSQTVVVMDGRVFVGGHFFTVNGRPRYKLFAVVPRTGRVDAGFTARPDTSVWTLTADPELGRLYIGGSFSDISGVAQSGFAQMSRAQ